MFWTPIILVALVVALLSWSPFVLLLFALMVIAVAAGYYGRSDGRMPNP